MIQKHFLQFFGLYDKYFLNMELYRLTLCLSSVLHGCPCGYYGTYTKKCRCTPNQIERYIAKISGPLMDRIDIHIEVPPVEFRKLRRRGHNGTGSEQLREQVHLARQKQIQRYGDSTKSNAMMSHRQVEAFCELDQAAEYVLRQALTEFALSARAHDKILKVARTIADLEQSNDVKLEHVTEAISYRKLDRAL